MWKIGWNLYMWVVNPLEPKIILWKTCLYRPCFIPGVFMWIQHTIFRIRLVKNKCSFKIDVLYQKEEDPTVKQGGSPMFARVKPMMLYYVCIHLLLLNLLQPLRFHSPNLKWKIGRQYRQSGLSNDILEIIIQLLSRLIHGFKTMKSFLYTVEAYILYKA